MSDPLVLYNGNKLTALEPETGAVRWAVDLAGSGPMARVAIRFGVVVLAGYEFLYCCDLATGQVLWRVPSKKAARIGVLVRDGRLFVYGNGTITAYDGRGNQLWCREELTHYGGSIGFSDDVCWIPESGG